MFEMFGEEEALGDNFVPDDVTREAAATLSGLLPEKSALSYEKEYNRFSDWRKSRNVIGVTEEVMLAYFGNKIEKSKVSSLWSYYSMLKKTLLVKENVDIARYSKVIALLKTKTSGYKPKKSDVLDRENLMVFLRNAEDEEYLLMKVVAIFGVAGGCRIDELHKITTDDVDDRGSVLVVSLPETKTKKMRVFTVISEGFSVNVLDIYRKYLNLRPKHVTHKSLFVNYRGGKCTTQRVGVNTLAKVPCKIAMFLKLSHPERYTGHCFRRSSATLLAEAGADMLSLKRHGGWKSSSVVEGYLEESLTTKLSACEKIMVGGKVDVCGGNSTLSMKEMVGQPVFNFSNCENFQLYFGSDEYPKTSV